MISMGDNPQDFILPVIFCGGVPFGITRTVNFLLTAILGLELVHTGATVKIIGYESCASIIIGPRKTSSIVLCGLLHFRGDIYCPSKLIAIISKESARNLKPPPVFHVSTIVSIVCLWQVPGSRRLQTQRHRCGSAMQLNQIIIAPTASARFAKTWRLP